MSGAGKLCRLVLLDGQRYRAIDDDGTLGGNSCNHAAWPNLKWKLGLLDGAQAKCAG